MPKAIGINFQWKRIPRGSELFIQIGEAMLGTVDRITKEKSKHKYTVETLKIQQGNLLRLPVQYSIGQYREGVYLSLANSCLNEYFTNIVFTGKSQARDIRVVAQIKLANGGYIKLEHCDLFENAPYNVAYAVRVN